MHKYRNVKDFFENYLGFRKWKYQQQALFLGEMNNRYAIDGRDPNSYSGIFWCLVRFDRAWQERPIFWEVSYMTSESARRKIKLKEYMKIWQPKMISLIIILSFCFRIFAIHKL